MAGNMRYDHGLMNDHVTSQASLVQYLQEKKVEAQNVINNLAHIWTEHGSDAAQQCHQQINMAFDQVFNTIQRHGHAIGQSSGRALTTDLGVKSGFSGI